jgi:hypothetical protein
VNTHVDKKATMVECGDWGTEKGSRANTCQRALTG